MYLASSITMFLYHLAIWALLLSIVIPLSICLWFLFYDLFFRETSIIKTKVGLEEKGAEKKTDLDTLQLTSKDKSDPKTSTSSKQVIYLDKETSLKEPYQEKEGE